MAKSLDDILKEALALTDEASKLLLAEQNHPQTQNIIRARQLLFYANKPA